jgi:hypothetical protein
LLGVEAARKIYELGERFLDRHAILLAVVVGDNLRVLLVEIHPLGITRQHLREFSLEQLPDVFNRCSLPFPFFQLPGGGRGI